MIRQAIFAPVHGVRYGRPRFPTTFRKRNTAVGERSVNKRDCELVSSLDLNRAALPHTVNWGRKGQPHHASTSRAASSRNWGQMVRADASSWKQLSQSKSL